jgi:amidase
MGTNWKGHYTTSLLDFYGRSRRVRATLLPAPDASREDYVARALEMISNTCPFDVTGHPAATVPAGMSEGLSVGMMLIGRHWEDGTVLRAADAFQIVG